MILYLFKELSPGFEAEVPKPYSLNPKRTISKTTLLRSEELTKSFSAGGDRIIISEVAEHLHIRELLSEKYAGNAAKKSAKER